MKTRHVGRQIKAHLAPLGSSSIEASTKATSTRNVLGMDRCAIGSTTQYLCPAAQTWVDGLPTRSCDVALRPPTFAMTRARPGMPSCDILIKSCNKLNSTMMLMAKKDPAVVVNIICTGLAAR